METINRKSFIVSDLFAFINKDENNIYKYKIEKDGKYRLAINDNVNVIIRYENKDICLNKQLDIELKRNKTLYVLISSSTSTYFHLEFYSLDNHIIFPYKSKIKDRGINIPLTSNNDVDCKKEAKIETSKRKGGLYIYNNTPESIKDIAVNTIFMEQDNLIGDCFMTFENQNATDSYDKIYLGYRLINKSTKDAYVTITNIGYQVEGSWLGEKSWMDYYGIKYDINIDSFKDDKDKYKWFHDYLNFDIDYKPSPIRPITYLLPPGKYFYVIGGKGKDNYLNLNINNTGNMAIKSHHCANGNVKFIINNSSLTGQFVCCDKEENINNNYVASLKKYSEKDDLGGRLGIAYHQGVIDYNPIFIFNDKTKPCFLPVSYHNRYEDNIKDHYKPRTILKNMKEHLIESDRWFTHLSSNFHHEYIGDDMVIHHTFYDNKPITLSTNIANPAGKIWDYGNWMIEYHDNDVFINQGNHDRKVKLYLHNGGSIFYIIKDENDNILKAGATLNTCTGKIPIYETTIKAHTRLLLSVIHVLPANNNGSIEHYIELI